MKLYGDKALVDYVRVMYGEDMADRCAEIFAADDPRGSNGFSRLIRRSLACEMDGRALVPAPAEGPHGQR